MAASRTKIQSSTHASGPRRWRSLLAGLISLALVLSFFLKPNKFLEGDLAGKELK